MNQVDLWNRLQSAFKELTGAGFLVLPNLGVNQFDCWRRVLEHPDAHKASGFVAWPYYHEESRIVGKAFRMYFAGPVGSYTLDDLFEECAEEYGPSWAEFNIQDSESTPFGGDYEISQQVEDALDKFGIPHGPFSREDLWFDHPSYIVDVLEVDEDAYGDGAQYGAYAEEGDAHAQYLLGKASFDEEFEWLQKAANQNHLGAYNELARLYRFGLADLAESLRYSRAAAELGDVEATYQLVDDYIYGTRDAEEDIEQAIYWLRKSNMEGYGFGGYRLVRLLEEYPQLQTHPEEATQLLLKLENTWSVSGLGEFAKVSLMLAIRYELGYGIGKDPEAALELFRRRIGGLLVSASSSAEQIARYAIALKTEGVSGDRLVRAIIKVGYSFELLPPELRNDRELVLDGIRGQYVYITDLSRELRSDREVVLEAMRFSFRTPLETLNRSTAELRNDRDMVLKALVVSNNYSAPNNLNLGRYDLLPSWWISDSEISSLVEAEGDRYGRWVEEKAHDGDVDAQYALGEEWYLKAAAQGHAKAQGRLGHQLIIKNRDEEEVGLSRDDGIDLCVLSARQGYTYAQETLGYEFRTANNVPASLNWFREAASRGSSDAAYAIVEIFELQEEKESYVTIEEAMKWLYLAVDTGNYLAEFDLACRYLHGDGVEQNLPVAEALITSDDNYPLDAEFTKTEGYYAIIRLYDDFNDRFGSIDEAVGDKTFDEIQTAADEGDEDANFLLGRMYEEGFECETDQVKAHQIFSDLASDGHAGGQFALARLYLEGSGVEEDAGEALRWYRLATDTTDKGSYEGELKGKKKHGYGTLTYENGTTLVGEWENDIFHGRGTITYGDNVTSDGVDRWKGGGEYVGEWKDGRKHGCGRHTDIEGNVYEGEYKDGERHGSGVLTYRDGEIEKGEFAEDKFAEGYRFDRSGIIVGKRYKFLGKQFEFVGFFKDGMHWAGKDYDEDGNVVATYSEGIRTEK